MSNFDSEFRPSPSAAPNFSFGIDLKISVNTRYRGPLGRGRGRPPKRFKLQPAPASLLAESSSMSRVESNDLNVVLKESLPLFRELEVSGRLASLATDQRQSALSFTNEDLSTAASVSDVPNEERSYLAMFPDLNVRTPMFIHCEHPSVSESMPSRSGPIILKGSITGTEGLLSSFTEGYRDLHDLTLPKASFRSIEPFVAHSSNRLQASINDRPSDGPYLNHLEPSELDLMRCIEYDMDEQDFRWLQSTCALLHFKFENSSTMKNSTGSPCTESRFEELIDFLEKEWGFLTRSIPEKARDDATYPEEIVCAICDDGECENSNAIVFCDGCNLAVHQDCYGVPFIPEGQWLCRKCMLSPETPISCVLCPNSGGAFKQTSGNRWVHLLCAMWIPECHISNSVYMEPVEGIENIPKGRWRLRCFICQKRHGAPIQCANKSCFTAFHVTCARKAKFYMKAKSPSGEFVYKAYCEKHTPKEYLEVVDVEASLAHVLSEFCPDPSLISSHDDDSPPASESEYAFRSKHSSVMRINDEEEEEGDVLESNLQQAAISEDSVECVVLEKSIIEKVSSRSPVIPWVIFSKCCAQFSELSADFIVMVCKYWSLKRLNRRGTPLLKRLHLQATLVPEDPRPKIENGALHKILQLRRTLDQIMSIVSIIKSKEAAWTRELQRQHVLCQNYMFPLNYVFLDVMEQLSRADRNSYFRAPVPLSLVPDYLLYIKEPMDFGTISDKISNFSYADIESFRRDVILVFDNCLLYNRPETSYWKVANRMKSNVDAWIAHATQKTTAQHILERPSLLSLDKLNVSRFFGELDRSISCLEKVVLAVDDRGKVAENVEKGEEKPESKDKLKRKEPSKKRLAGSLDPSIHLNAVGDDKGGNEHSDKQRRRSSRVIPSGPKLPPSSFIRSIDSAPLSQVDFEDAAGLRVILGGAAVAKKETKKKQRASLEQ